MSSFMGFPVLLCPPITNTQLLLLPTAILWKPTFLPSLLRSAVLSIKPTNPFASQTSLSLLMIVCLRGYIPIPIPIHLLVGEHIIHQTIARLSLQFVLQRVVLSFIVAKFTVSMSGIKEKVQVYCRTVLLRDANRLE